MGFYRYFTKRNKQEDIPRTLLNLDDIKRVIILFNGSKEESRIAVKEYAKHHPLGATGVANIYEVSTHLRGEAGARQVEGAKTGLTHVIGLGSACGIHILEATS